MTQATVLHILETTLQKTGDWVAEFMEHTGRMDEEKAWQMLRGVLHVLRDRLTVEQCAHLAAQLPLVIRGLYFEGWKPSHQPVKLRSRQEFIDAVFEQFQGNPGIDARQAIEGTFYVLNQRISPGELKKIKGMLQPELRELWPTCGEE